VPVVCQDEEEFELRPPIGGICGHRGKREVTGAIGIDLVRSHPRPPLLDRGYAVVQYVVNLIHMALAIEVRPRHASNKAGFGGGVRIWPVMVNA